MRVIFNVLRKMNCRFKKAGTVDSFNLGGKSAVVHGSKLMLAEGEKNLSAQI